VLGAVLLAVLGGLTGSYGSYWLAPAQDQAVKDSQKHRDLGVPVEVTEVAHHRILPSYAIAGTASIDTIRVAAVSHSLPDQFISGTFIGQKEYSKQLVPGETELPGQPRVYDAISFTVSNPRAEPVKVSNIRLEIVARSPMVNGTLLHLLPQGEGTVPELLFDLDNADSGPYVINQEAEKGTETKYFQVKQIELDPSEQFGVMAFVSTRTCNCSYRFVVVLSDGTTTIVQDGDKPFALSGFAPSYRESFAFNGRTVAECTWPSCGD
jgi:hypothetical protein